MGFSRTINRRPILKKKIPKDTPKIGYQFLSSLFIATIFLSNRSCDLQSVWECFIIFHEVFNTNSTKKVWDTVQQEPVTLQSETKNALELVGKIKLKLILKAILVGLLGGLVVCSFRYLLSRSESLVRTAFQFVRGHLAWLPVLILIYCILGVIVGTIVKTEPMIKGSGIPQVEGQLIGAFHINWLPALIKKYIGGLLSIGSGLNLGREGPSIQLNALVGQGVADLFHSPDYEKKILITCGASAGLSAAFSAPLAGVLFALEEVHKNFSSVILLTSMVSSVSASLVAGIFFGTTPSLYMGQLSPLPVRLYLLLALMGILLGLFGALYNKVLLKTQDLYAKITHLRPFSQILIPFLLVIPVGLCFPDLLGGGHHIVTLLETKDFALGALLLFLLVRFVFSMVSYGSGAPGGIFLPLLALGACFGAIFAGGAQSLFSFEDSYRINFIVFAMAGYLTAVVRSPITASILITEMSGSFRNFLPVIIVCLFAYVTANLLPGKPVYESLLERILPKEKSLHNSTGKEIIEISVEPGSYMENMRIKDLVWPKQSLLVAIHRGCLEILPKGDTVLQAQDNLVILTDGVYLNEVRSKLESAATHSVLS